MVDANNEEVSRVALRRIELEERRINLQRETPKHTVPAASWGTSGAAEIPWRQRADVV
jgi:hypothetical protein